MSSFNSPLEKALHGQLQQPPGYAVLLWALQMLMSDVDAHSHRLIRTHSYREGT